MCGCEGAYRPHPVVNPDPGTLDIRNLELLSSAGRADSAAVETRAAVGVQTQEVPWFFARTLHPERIQLEENNGDKGHVPMVRHERLIQMSPWLETPPTVVRVALPTDSGLGGISKCQ